MVNTLPIGKKLQELLAGDQWNTVIKNPIKYRKKMDNYAQELVLHSTADIQHAGDDEPACFSAASHRCTTDHREGKLPKQNGSPQKVILNEFTL